MMKKMLFFLMVMISLRSIAQKDTIPCLFFYADTSTGYDIVIYELRHIGRKDTLIKESENNPGKFITYYDSLVIVHDDKVHWVKGYKVSGDDHKYLMGDKAALGKGFIAWEPK